MKISYAKFIADLVSIFQVATVINLGVKFYN